MPDPRFRCVKCSSGAFMSAGEGKTKGFMGHKGEKWKCMMCGHFHLADNFGNLLADGDGIK